MNHIQSQDIPTIHPLPSNKTHHVPPKGTKRINYNQYDFSLEKLEEKSLNLINNISFPDEKWVRFIDARWYVSSHKRIIVKGNLSTDTIAIVADRYRYIRLELYLICFKGYDPDVHLIDWKLGDVVPRYLTPDEEWMPVKTRSGSLVYASNLGRIHSNRNRLLRQYVNDTGYVRVVCGGMYEFVHRLVYQAFNPDVNIDGYVVNHINHTRNDNRLENLESVTQQENMQYCYTYGHGAVQLGRISEAYVPDHKKVDTSNWKF